MVSLRLKKMMNEKILRDYKQEVLELFKSHYKKMISKDLNLEFKSVLRSVVTELGIVDFDHKDVIFLEEWFNLINYQQFIFFVLEGNDFNEIIFHSNENIQVITNQKKEIREIANLTNDDYQLSLEIFSLKNNISWNFAEPFASFTINMNASNYRFTLIHHSTSANKRSKVFIRCLQTINPSLDQFQIPPTALGMVKDLVISKQNILISGSTGSGKTTFMRALLNEIPKDEHIIVLEDTHEILPFSPHQTSFLAQQDLSKKSLKDYCAYALRMSPERLVVGEMRSTEVVPFMLAMNTGHRGLMSTIHANSAIDAVSRIALLFSLYAENKEIDFSLITKLACKNINYVIHMENKRIKEIARIIGSEGENPFYEIIS